MPLFLCNGRSWNLLLLGMCTLTLNTLKNGVVSILRVIVIVVAFVVTVVIFHNVTAFGQLV
jgi:hypothetical protein